MSYDFTLFKPRSGENPLITARRVGTVESPVPGAGLGRRRIAEALLSHNPRLNEFRPDFDEIAKLEDVSVEQVRREWRHIELNDESFGIQFTIYDNWVSITVPYWHEGAKAVEVFRTMWGYFEVIHREAGYVVYDPQLEQVFDPKADYSAASACYGTVMQKIEDARHSPARKPWWRIW
jgi:hypothetical protein